MPERPYTDLDDEVLRHILDLNDTGSYQDEQIFTDVFFGMLQLLGAEGLNTLFGETVLNENEVFDEAPQITFDEYVCKKRPDAVLETSQTVIMVEVKTGADYQLNQLSDQLDELRDEYRSKSSQKLVNITGHLTAPDEATELSDEDEFEWVSWYDMDSILQKRLNDSERVDSTKRVFSLLHQLLSIHEYIGFSGMDFDVLETISKTTSQREDVVREFEGLVNSTVAKVRNKMDEDITGPKFWGFNEFEVPPSKSVGLYFATFHPNIIYGGNGPSTNRPFGYIRLTEATRSISAGLSLRINRKNDKQKEYYSNTAVDEDRDELFALVRGLGGDLVLSDNHESTDFTKIPDLSENSHLKNLSTGEKEPLSKSSKIDTYEWRERTQDVKRVNVVCRHYLNNLDEARVDESIADEIIELFTWARQAHS